MALFNRTPVIAAIGTVSWDESYVLDQYPAEGGSARIREIHSAPGGTTGNLAMTARTLGASVRLWARIGSDQRGNDLHQSLAKAGIDLAGVIRDPGPADLSVMLVSGETTERTILWQQAPTIRRRDRIDVDALLAADITVLDCVEYDLRQLLSDLPAHTRPGARLLGTLTYLADVVAHDKLEVALRHDILVGNQREYCALLGESDPDASLKRLAAAMPGTNLRLAVMTCGARGSMAVSPGGSWQVPARSVVSRDETGAGDAFAGALAFAQALRWDVETSLRFANSTASYVVGSLGAQSALPTVETVLDAMTGSGQ